MSDDVPIPESTRLKDEAALQQAMLYCPNCSAKLGERGCKLRCPRCHYYMSCSDYV